MNSADVLVGNFPGETQFSFEIVLHRWVGGNLRFQNFQGNNFFRFQVTNFIDHARSACAHL